MIAVLAEITRTNDLKLSLQILHYDERSWIQEQTLESSDTIKPSFFFKIHGRLFLNSHKLGTFTLDLKSLTFVSFPEWINETSLSNTANLFIIDLAKSFA